MNVYVLLCYYSNMLNIIHTYHYLELRYHDPVTTLSNLYYGFNILSCRDKLDKRAEINS